MNSLDTEEHINLPALIIKHMARIIDPTPSPHGLAYGFLLFSVFEALRVPQVEGKKAKKNIIDKNTLVECDCLVTKGPSSKETSPVTQMLIDLQVAQGQNEILSEEITGLKSQLVISWSEILKLKEQMLQQLLSHNDHVDTLLFIIQKNYASSAPS